MDLNKLIGNPSEGIPESLKPVIAALLEGDLRSMIVIGEHVNGSMSHLWELNINDQPSNEMALLGALEFIKHDLLYGLTQPEEQDDE